MRPVSFFQKAEKFLLYPQKQFLFYLFAVLILAMLLELLIRFFLKASIFGLLDFVGFASVWIYAIGAAFASYERSHIKAEFLSIAVKSERIRAFARFFSALVSTGMSVLFTKWSWDLCVYSISINEMTQAYPVPKVIFQASFFIGGILMSLYFFREAIDCFMDFRRQARNKTASPPPA